jgi:hypothetical protein
MRMKCAVEGHSIEVFKPQKSALVLHLGPAGWESFNFQEPGQRQIIVKQSHKLENWMVYTTKFW